MKAVVQARYGSPEALEVREVEIPAAGEGEVLVRVRAASLHPDVWHVVCGRPYVLRLLGSGVFRPKQPIPGTDMAGVVESTGTGVSALRVGDAVFGETTEWAWSNGGAFAEYVAVPQRLLAAKPANVTFEQAASVPASGLIALQSGRGTRHDWRGKRVLINGAGGGVGSIVLQVAKACGADVTAVDVAGKETMLRTLGADAFIDFAREDFTRRGERYDLIVDVPGIRPLSDFTRALLPEGRYVPIGHEGFGAAGRRFFGLVPHFLGLMLRARFDPRLRGPGPIPSRGEVMSTLSDLLESGTLTPIIDGVYPLGEVRAAFRRMTGGECRGKVLLVP